MSRPTKLYPCMVCEKLHAEIEDAEVCERSHARCDTHADRPATHELGAHMPNGDGTSGLKVSRHLCDECYAEWRRHNIAFEYVR